MRVRERSGSGMCRQDLAWRSAGQPEQLPTLGVLLHQRPESSPFSAQSKRDISWYDGVVLSQPLARGGVPGRDSRQVARGLLLLPTGVSPVPAWGAQGCAGGAGRWPGRNGWPSQPSIRSADALQGLQIPPSFLGNKVVCVWKRVQMWLR